MSNANSLIIDYFDIKTYHETMEFLNSKIPESLKHVTLGVVCGSGLGGLVDCFDGETFSINYCDIPHFPTTSVQGHSGKLVFGEICKVKTVCMLGRMHPYEGSSI
jgi:purine-nucleoside phosphorylase